MKNIAIIGSTGKIGSQTLEVIRSYPDDFKVVGLACRHPSEIFADQVKEFRPEISAVAEKDGEEKITEMVTRPEIDLVIMAVVGLSGLKPTLAAIKAKKTVALATKEVLVIAGQIVMEAIKKYQTTLIPLDSEHSAIFQSLKSGKKESIKKVILTMGKGPIARMREKELENVTIKDIFNRPAWTMGTKIAVDSATGMNKSFEVIEARWLFNLRPDQIEIVVHPQYLCHSLVEFVDGSIITELGSPDMRRYLQYALFYPERKESRVTEFVDLIGKKLTFEKPPFEKFSCLKLGFKALKSMGTMPAVMHGADRAGVEDFLENKIRFTEIPEVIIKTMDSHRVIKKPTLDQLLKAEEWGFNYAKKLTERKKL